MWGGREGGGGKWVRFHGFQQVLVLTHLFGYNEAHVIIK